MHHDITVHRVVKSSKRAGQYIEPHIHAFFHFIYGLDGHLQVQVGAKRIQTKPGILVMVPPGVEHSVDSLDTSISLDIKFSCSSETAQIMAGLPTAAGPLNDQAGCLLRCILDEAIAQSFGYCLTIGVLFKSVGVYFFIYNEIKRKEVHEEWEKRKSHVESGAKWEIRRLLLGETAYSGKVSDMGRNCRSHADRKARRLKDNILWKFSAHTAGKIRLMK